MAFQNKTALSNSFQQKDPQNWVDDLLNSLGAVQRIAAAIDTASVTQTIGTVPANSIILNRYIARTTAWNAAPTAFEVGKAGTTDWLVTTLQANVDGAITGGEAGEIETVSLFKFVTAATPIVLTLDHNSASAGAAYVVVEYMEVTQ